MRFIVFFYSTISICRVIILRCPSVSPQASSIVHELTHATQPEAMAAATTALARATGRGSELDDVTRFLGLNHISVRHIDGIVAALTDNTIYSRGPNLPYLTMTPFRLEGLTTTVEDMICSNAGRRGTVCFGAGENNTYGFHWNLEAGVSPVTIYSQNGELPGVSIKVAGQLWRNVGNTAGVNLPTVSLYTACPSPPNSPTTGTPAMYHGATLFADASVSGAGEQAEEVRPPCFFLLHVWDCGISPSRVFTCWVANLTDHFSVPLSSHITVRREKLLANGRWESC